MRINFSINIGVEFYIKETGINKNFYYKTSGVAEKGRKKNSIYLLTCFIIIYHILYGILLSSTYSVQPKKNNKNKK